MFFVRYEAEAMYFDPVIRAQKNAELLAAVEAEVKPLIENQSKLLTNLAEADMVEALASLDTKPFPFNFSSSSSSAKSSLLTKYEALFASLAVPGLPWSNSEVVSSLTMLMDSTIAQHRARFFKSALDQAEKQHLSSRLSTPIKSLLESCPDNLWPKLYAVCLSASNEISGTLLAMLKGFDVIDGERAQLISEVSSRVQAKMVFHVKSASESLITRLNQGFSDHFTLDENKVPRSWSRQDIPLLASSARNRAAAIMSQLSIIRRDKPSETLIEAYQLVDAAISNLAGTEPSQPLYELKAIDLSTMSRWPEVIIEDDVLLQPQAVHSTWQQLINSSNLLVQQATATQEAYKANNRGPPLWAIAAMVVLGWNEFWALVYSPLYLTLGLLAFLFLRTLYYELDVEQEFHRGSLPAFLSLAPRILPASKAIIERSVLALRGFSSRLPDHIKVVQKVLSSSEDLKEVQLTPLFTNEEKKKDK